MKLNVATREIERHAVKTEQVFTIRASPKAFQILSSNLYKNKIRAIIRETCCNAYDAHVASGEPNKPFMVHLPSILEPYFSVRDDGIGLADEDIRETYTTYFGSTKIDSNNYIGAMGLGTKSPFSYVDSFTVASRHNGMKRIYACFVSETGEPAITMMSEMPTIEHNGIEVSLPVKNGKDHTSFVNEAEIILSDFKHSPIIIGCNNFKFEDRTVLVEHSDWRFFHKSNREATAVMGNVAYPVALSSITSLSIAARRVYACSIEIDFPIGALDVTAGREELSYDKNTLKTLEDRAQTIIQEAPDVFRRMFVDCANEFAAKVLYGNILRESCIGHQLLGVCLPILFNGVEIIDCNMVADLTNFPSTIVTVFSKYDRRTTTFSAKHREKLYLRCKYNDDSVIVYDDLDGKGYKARINEQRKIKETIIGVICADKAELERFKKIVDGFPSVKTSELTTRYRSKKKSVTRIMQLSESCWTNMIYHRKLCVDDWKEVDVDLSNGGYYVQRVGHMAINGQTTDEYLCKKLVAAQSLGIINSKSPIYGLNKKTVKTLNGQWQNVNDVLDDWVKNVAKDADTLNTYYATKECETLLTRTMHALRKHFGKIKDHIFHDLVENYEKGNSQSNMPIYQLMRWSGVIPARLNTLGVQYAAIMNNYPLLQTLTSSELNNLSTDHVLDYIQFCDKSKRNRFKKI